MLNQWKRKHIYPVCLRDTVLQHSAETDYCLPLSRMARMEMDYNFKTLTNFLIFSLCIIRLFGPELTLDRFLRKDLS